MKVVIDGEMCYFDDEDIPVLFGHKITVNRTNENYKRLFIWINKKPILLHRYLMMPKDDNVVDHIDGNPLNNKRSNLRMCTRKENSWNSRKRKKHKGSRYNGVTFNGVSWVAQCRNENGNRQYLGSFKSECDAAMAYNNAVSYRKDFAAYNVSEYNQHFANDLMSQ